MLFAVFLPIFFNYLVFWSTRCTFTAFVLTGIVLLLSSELNVIEISKSDDLLDALYSVEQEKSISRFFFLFFCSIFVNFIHI